MVDIFFIKRIRYPWKNKKNNHFPLEILLFLIDLTGKLCENLVVSFTFWTTQGKFQPRFCGDPEKSEIGNPLKKFVHSPVWLKNGIAPKADLDHVTYGL